jgi:hypothetical protein
MEGGGRWLSPPARIVGSALPSLCKQTVPTRTAETQRIDLDAEGRPSAFLSTVYLVVCALDLADHERDRTDGTSKYFLQLQKKKRGDLPNVFVHDDLSEPFSGRK